MQTRDTARAVGLRDRGVLEPGMRADINVVDFDGLRLARPELVYDLPAGGKRLVQRVTGYAHTFVAGEETYRAGEWTGATPGRVIRGA
jgi:N-acyl-D-aspartate/D-glutamate deacylase